MSIANDCYRKTDENCERYPTAERPDVEQPNTLNDIHSDVFGNEFYNYSKTYVRRDINCQVVTTTPPANPKDRVPGTLYVQKLNGQDYVRNGIDNQPCTSTDPTDGQCNIFQFDAGDWERKDYENKTPTENQVENRNMYIPRDYIPRYIDNTPKPLVCKFPITFTPGVEPDVDISDYEFTYEDGRFIAREEGLDDLIEPEDYTVLYS